MFFKYGDSNSERRGGLSAGLGFYIGSPAGLQLFLDASVMAFSAFIAFVNIILKLNRSCSRVSKKLQKEISFVHILKSFYH
ncbi:hypothetical protein KFK09_001400 [Dendrobium nobile]|uniref:Uncharacterized protein n=1 Tax=Dendrobium nobile TaxID=94219 RepID=A0A8T3C767_DENNO|nr:hypothetical protein KFK09_001400 [Dendrobium nobile]